MSRSVEEQLGAHPCPTCGHYTLELELRPEVQLYARPLGSWSLAGQQPKTSASEITVDWPYAVCSTDGCDFVKRATHA